jgi:DNA-binding CsgD family transcriptional regulator
VGRAATEVVTEGVVACRQTEMAASESPNPRAVARLSPRAWQTLVCVLAGHSEKEIAVALGIKRNTVHVYVKWLYAWFGVATRAELIARFLPELSEAALKKLVRRGQLKERRATVTLWASVKSWSVARVSPDRRNTFGGDGACAREPGGVGSRRQTIASEKNTTRNSARLRISRPAGAWPRGGDLHP